MNNDNRTEHGVADSDAAAGTGTNGSRAELLGRLRIEPDEREAGGSRWTGRIAVALIAVGVLGAGARAGRGWLDVAEVRAATVEAVATGGTERVSASALDASGYVVARRQATVSSKITGRVVELSIEEGQHVEAGEVVARLDDTNARAAAAQATAELTRAETALRAAQVTYSDNQPLYDRNETQFHAGFVSAQTFDRARADLNATRTAVEVAAAAVGVAEANLAVQQRNLEDTVVRAPFSGVVTVKAAQEGEMVSPVSAGGGFTRTGIGTIVDMSSLEVEVDVNESFINRVSPGQPAEVRLNAYPDWRIPAHVIAIVPTADRAKATVRVRVGFENGDDRILPQMGVRVAFLEDTSESGNDGVSSSWIVPVDAIERAGDTGYVYLIRNGHLERRAVRLGSQTDAGQIVTAGLNTGMRVAVAAPGTLTDGMRVRVSNEEEKG